MTSVTPHIGSDGTDLPAGTPRGTTVINDAVVAKIAGLAVREVTGVHAVGGGAARALGAIREALSSTDHSQGVSVNVTGPLVAVELSIVAEYPLPLQQVADDARTAIIDAIETLVGLEVTEVNVTINDVHLPDETDETDDTGEVPHP
ncbi:Asp23/Gls24 family envelope stress response protein [Cryobacterium sp. N22]|uniref:Asp23/Gls24 family envelope stress response protein n=1 Tax=Cryobacterium sp. N22 TaxID=2048290 RepID=UPI000CE2D08F|nr:Asp23/Gls24 family envelope stress response protein [Cryobacterium sp. N22]